MTTDYLLVDISLNLVCSVLQIMVNDYSDFQHNYFSMTEQLDLLYLK